MNYGEIIAYPKYTGYIFLQRVYDVQFPYRAHCEILISHIEHLGDIYGWQGVPVQGNVVQEQFEIANDDELPHPALLYPAALRNFHVTFIGCSDSPRRVNAQWPLSCNG